MRGLARALRELTAVPSQIAGGVADSITARLAAGYAAGTDPHGAAWAPLRPATLAKGRTPPPLTDTGVMAAGTLARATGGAGIALEAPDPAGIHFAGTAFMAARPPLPSNGLPATWRADIRDAVSKRAAARLGAV